jgi:hypothetical protein
VAAVLALVLAAAGWGLQSSLIDTAETVRDDFAEVTATIPLPPARPGKSRTWTRTAGTVRRRRS